MDRLELELGRLKRRNQTRYEYAVDELGKEVDRLTPEFTGSIEIKVPILDGNIGGVTITVSRRQPKP